MRWVRHGLLGLAMVSCGPPATASREPESVAAAETQLQLVTETMRWDALPTLTDPAPSPIHFEALDGTPLPLTELEVRAAQQGPLALTELHMTFTNPLAEGIEGRLSLVLPDGAEISRVAMEVGDRYQEGEVVERARATRAYEGFLHRGVDPAHLDVEGGNRFTVRVFPVGSVKRLVVSYSQVLVDEGYRVRLAGLAPLRRLTVRAISRERGVQRVRTLERDTFTPDRDFVLPATSLDAVRSGPLAVARVSVPGKPGVDPLGDLAVLVDTSASSSLREALDAVDRVVQRLDDDATLSVAAFDQEVVEIYRGPRSGFTAAVRDRIAQRGALGATRIEWALREAATRGLLASRTVVVSDGVTSVGGDGSGRLAKRLRRAGVTRVDAIATGAAHDVPALRALAMRGVVVKPGGGVLDALEHHPGQPLEIEVPGSRWSWPPRVHGAAPGEPLLVVAELDAGKPLVVAFSGPDGTQRVDVPAAVARPELIERAVGSARLKAARRSWAASPPGDARARLRDQVIALSRKHRIATELSSFLVLETERDYREHGIARADLRDIVTVGERGVDVLARSFDDVASVRGGMVLPPDVGAPPPAEPAEPRRVFIKNSRIVVVERVFFTHGAEILTRSHALLREIAKVMLEHPALIVEVAGHTDSRGSAAANRRLSVRRARAVKAFLVGEGVPAERLKVAGYGEDRPLAANHTADGRAHNRRVEFKVLNLATGAARRKGGAPVDAAHGPFAAVLRALADGDLDTAERTALAFRASDSRGRLPPLALGAVLEARGRHDAAARAYGSIADLFAGRVEDVRIAGMRIERAGASAPDPAVQARLRALAIEAYRMSIRSRPDHLAGHRLLAYALAGAGQLDEGLRAIEAAIARLGTQGTATILLDDLALLGSVLAAREPQASDRVVQILERHGARLSTDPSLRVVMAWEADATDVDVMIRSSDGAEPEPCTDASRDVSTGYGPECWILENPERAATYTIGAKYIRKRAMGPAIGEVRVVRHDGQGNLRIDARPFTIMVRDGYAPLGEVSTE